MNPNKLQTSYNETRALMNMASNRLNELMEEVTVGIEEINRLKAENVALKASAKDEEEQTVTVD